MSSFEFGKTTVCKGQREGRAERLLGECVEGLNQGGSHEGGNFSHL